MEHLKVRLWLTKLIKWWKLSKTSKRFKRKDVTSFEKVKLRDIHTLIEYNGDFYTAKQLASFLDVSMDFELTRSK